MTRRIRRFVYFYDEGELTSQAILGGDDTSAEYFVGSRQGTLAVIEKFVPQGVHHILIGPDHLLFLIGLLLLGGDLRRMLLVVTAITVAHSVTLALAVLGVVSPPGGIVEPIIALSIVYVGADNLLVRGGRDMRVWIALVFGLIHGFDSPASCAPWACRAERSAGRCFRSISAWKSGNSRLPSSWRRR